MTDPLSPTAAGDDERRLATERLELAVAGAGVGVWDRHLPSGRGYVDARWCEMLGYRPGELPADRDTWRAMVHPADWPSVQESLERHFRDEAPMYECEYRIRHREGHWVWVLTRGRLTERDADGAPVRIVGTHMDVSDRKRTEEALARNAELLRSSEERLALVMRASNDGAWDWNMLTGETHYSPRWWEMFGYAIGELPADATLWRRLIHPDDLPRVMQVAADALASGRSNYEVEVRFCHKAGHLVPVYGRVYMLRDAEGKAIRVSGTNTDLTERKRFEQTLRESEERFRSLTELSSDWYWEQDADFRYVRITGSADKMRVLDKDSLGRTRWELNAKDNPDVDWGAHRALLEAHLPFYNFEIQRVDPQGRPVWMSISGRPFFDAQGVFAGYRGVGRNITENKLAQEEIRRLAFHDVLTGLPNRRLLVDRFQHALAATARSQRHGALLFLDLDNFKELNDRYGHEAGDLLLQQVAQRLTGCVRSMDTVARLGGDEFIVVLEDLDAAPALAAAQTARVGEDMLAVLNQPYRLGVHTHHCSPSIGAALFCGDHESVDELLKRADQAMYGAKAAGRNRLCFHAPAGVATPEIVFG
jgi:diguanylate cyclase (GGDEF)-like protein/PAS domain S-box-containing protein